MSVTLLTDGKNSGMYTMEMEHDGIILAPPWITAHLHFPHACPNPLGYSRDNKRRGKIPGNGPLTQ